MYRCINVCMYVCNITDAYVWYQSKGVGGGGYFLQNTVTFIPQSDLNFRHLFSCDTMGYTVA